MSFIRHEIKGSVGADGAPPRRALLVHHVDLVSRLRDSFPGFSDDVIVRLGQWSPKQREFVGLYYRDRHVGTMDRGYMPQWPEWKTTMKLVRVDLDYALTHDDLPLVELDKNKMPRINGQTTARVLRPKLASIHKVGWAEVFWKIIGLNVSGLDAAWLGSTFRVPMDWMANANHSPMTQSFIIARKRGYA